MKIKLNIRCELARMILVVALLLGAAISSRASSTVIMSYDAGTNGVPAVAPNPTNAAGGSWNAVLFNVDGTNILTEGLSPDPLYTNLNTWRTLDNSTAAAAVRFQLSPTDQEVTNAIWCGWKASAYWRIADPVPGNAGSVAVFFSFGSTNTLWNRRYTCLLDIDANGALYATTTTTTSIITTNTTDALAYHLYEIVYDSATHTASLVVDGQVINSNWPSLSVPASVSGALWGTGSTAGRGDGYWNSVKVEVNDPAPTTVTLDPVGSTNNVGDSVTFTADFTGCATGLQWYKDYYPIPGANQRSYTVPFIEPTDAGDYWLGITDPQTGTEVDTAPATLTVNPDSTPPSVVSVYPDLSLQNVQVKFSEGIDPATAEDPANYQVAGGVLSVTNATLLDQLTVDLQMVTEEAPGSNYDLTISGVQDVSGNPMPTTNLTFTAPNLVPVSEYYAGTSNNPAMAPDPASIAGGRWYLAGVTNDLMTVGGVSPDPGYDFNAWSMNDNNSGAGSAQYRMDYSPASLDFARTNGWRGKFRCRMVDDYGSPTPSGQGIIFGGNPTGRRYVVYMRQSGIDLDLNVLLYGGIATNVTTGGVGATDYHTHEVVLDPVTGLASYYFDGKLIFSGWNGIGGVNGYDGPFWGSFSSAGLGNINYNQVEFSVVNATPPVIETSPVDSTVAFGGSVTLSGSASGFVAGYQWYKDGTPIDGARKDSYTVTSASDADQGQYTLHAFNSFTDVQSSPATLTVGPMLSIGTTNGYPMIMFTGTLQSSTSVNGTYTDVTPTPTSPLILSNAPDAQLFFRSYK